MMYAFEDLDLTGWRFAFDADVQAALACYYEAPAFPNDEPWNRAAHAVDECRISPDRSQVLICDHEPLALIVLKDGRWVLELDPWAWPLSKL